MSLFGKGSKFIYVKSTFEIRNSAHGTYGFSGPDTIGTAFSPPCHPKIHRIFTDKETPNLTKEELESLQTILDFCGLNLQLIWIEYTNVRYS